MLTRGLIIGKIVDDIAGLKYQVKTRNKCKLYDLSKFCEDFCREVLNLIYNYNLSNLNNERANVPGIDLGDKTNKIAFQITSEKYSPKIVATLEAITLEQKNDYKSIFVFILGEKATSYTIEQKLLDKFSFNVKENILDLDDLLRDIMVADIEILYSLYSLFQREFRQVRIELEPVDSEGNFESSLYNQIEHIPNVKPVNAKKLADFFSDDNFDGDTVNLNTIQKLYSTLSKIPRITRELIPIIVERGAKRRFNHEYDEYGILPQVLKNSLRFTDVELNSEIAILTDADIVYIGERHIGEELNYYITLADMTITVLIDWALENGYSLRKMFNAMEWTILDE